MANHLRKHLAKKVAIDLALVVHQKLGCNLIDRGARHFPLVKCLQQHAPRFLSIAELLAVGLRFALQRRTTTTRLASWFPLSRRPLTLAAACHELGVTT